MALGLAPLSLMPSASAQSNAPNNYAISALGGAPQFAADRIVSGEFNGTALRDIALLRGNRLTFNFDPSLGEATGDLDGRFDDIANYPGLNSNTQDALLAVGPGISMSRLLWDPSTSVFSPIAIFDPQSPASATCTALSRIDVGQVDGQMGQDIVMVLRDRRTIRLVESVGDGAFGVVPTQQFRAVLPDDIVDLCLVDGDGNGQAHIAAFSDSHLLVVNGSGQLVFQASLVGTVIAAETVSDGASNRQNCAVLLRDVLGRTDLYVFDGETFGLLQQLDVSNWSPTQLTAADYDINETTDLTLTTDTGHGPVCLLQELDYFSTHSNQVLSLTDSSAPPVAPGSVVAIFDVEGDSDKDLIYPVASKDQIYMAKNGAFDHRGLEPRMLDTGPLHIWHEANNLLKVRYMWRPGGTTPGPGGLVVPLDATHLQVMLWASIRTGLSDYETQPIPLSDTALSLSNHPFSTTSQTPDPYVELEFDSFTTLDPNKDLLFLTARYVQLDDQRVIKAAWPHQTTYIALQQNPDGLAYLDGLPFTSAGLALSSADPFLGQIGGTQVGGGGATGCIPDYPPNAPPPQEPPPVP